MSEEEEGRGKSERERKKRGPFSPLPDDEGGGPGSTVPAEKGAPSPSES